MLSAIIFPHSHILLIILGFMYYVVMLFSYLTITIVQPFMHAVYF